MENLVACCVRCNSQQGAGERRPLLAVSDEKWFGFADHFIVLAPDYKKHLTKIDLDWFKALHWAELPLSAVDSKIAIAALKAKYSPSLKEFE